ncbi:MAG: hypothetical protein J7L31_02560 [Thermoplasmata archaeon]|nr:hypothetical protein [Thermoplasmata archaeon]
MEFRTISDLKKYLSMLEQKRHHPEDYVIGIEMEGALVDAEGKPLDVKDLIPKLNSIYHDFEFDKEAGACQLEIRTFPRKFSTESLREKEEYFLDVVEEIVEQAERVHKTEAIFLLLGSNPHPDVLSDRWITSSQRAKTMAEWRREFPEVKIAGKTIRPEHVATAIQSMHIHIQGVSPDDVADKYNHLLYMVPGQIAISANSPIIGGELVDYAEARLLLYEMADGGNAGLPKHRTYPISFLGYARYVDSFSPILAKSLTEKVKERHEDNRIRLEVPFRVENRVTPIQCTIRENMAMIEYIIGRLKYAQRWSRMDYPSLKEIEVNRIEAIRKSLKGEFIWNGKSTNVRDFLTQCIEKAEKGLEELDTKPRYIHCLKRRVRKKRVSADVVRGWYRRGSEGDKIAYVVNRVWEHTKKNRPII